MTALRDEGAEAFLEACREAHLRLDWRGTSVSLLAPHSVFSPGRVDEGTRLLLDALPAEPPRSFLDLGCGYGALGLPVARLFPEVRGILIDRDLLAVEFARKNAEHIGAPNVRVLPSLGFSGLPQGEASFGWVLANLPARVGEGVVEHLLAGSALRLEDDGRAFVVIIAPLAEAVERAAERRGLPAERIAATPRHVVFALRRGAGEAAPPSEAEPAGSKRDAPSVYRRDSIEYALPQEVRDGLPAGIPGWGGGTLRLHRPTDLADEPHRLGAAIPLLADRLFKDRPPVHRPPADSEPAVPPSRGAPRSVLVVRSGYGLVPALALASHPHARVVALDRDLLATAFTRWNCEGAGARLRVLEAVAPSAAAGEGPFDLILGEILPPLGLRAMARELAEARSLLAPGGRGLFVGQLRPARDLVRAEGASLGLRIEGTREMAGLIGFGLAPPSGT